MSEVMTLQLVKCPACNKPLTTFSSFKSTITCPRCGAAIRNPEYVAKQESRPERIIPFTTNEKNFEQSLINALVNRDYVPRDIFSAISTDNVFRAYLPMYLFEGSFQASWSCETSYMDETVSVNKNIFSDTVDIKNKKVKKWRPQNGNASGNFAFLCLANEDSEDLPDELRRFTYQFPYEVMLSKAFDADMLSDEDDKLITIPRNADSVLVWQRHGTSMVNAAAERAAIFQLRNQEARDFHCQSSYTLATKGEYILAPFWFVYYTYNQNRYHYMLDGVGKYDSYTYPIDQEEVNFVRGKERIMKLVGLAWILCALLFFLNEGVAVVSLIIWFIAKLIVNFIMKRKIKARLDESRLIRAQAAAALS
ncbi:MAG: hypothetical protein E7031_06015 [Akkermansiaceae bacterium]|nr:hypothetical protein [Akkermansiaceae bacterium]